MTWLYITHNKLLMNLRGCFEVAIKVRIVEYVIKQPSHSIKELCIYLMFYKKVMVSQVVIQHY